MKLPRYWGLVVLGILLLLGGLGLTMMMSVCTVKEENPGVKTTFDELEFVVVHRPHLTYFIDMKYLLCFATRKPNYQDLAQFHCPENLWKEVESSLKGQTKVKVPKKKGTVDARP